MPLWTQGGSFRADECFSLRQRSETLPLRLGLKGCVSAEAPVDVLVQENVYLCIVLLELSLYFGFCSVSALKRKLRIPGKVKTSHSVGK